MDTNKERKLIYLLKAFAIFSVVCAHTAVEPENCSFVVRLIVKLLSYTGTLGVPLFFIISAFLFAKNKHSFTVFWKIKSKTIILPWVFCETIVWLYVVLRKGGISLVAWLKFLLGINHSTYYLTILLILYFMFWWIKKSNVGVTVCILFSAVMLITGGWGNTIAMKLNQWTITPYMNLLNWMIYFASGILLQKTEKIKDLFYLSKKVFLASSLGLSFMMVIHFLYNIPWSYFSQYALINIVLQILVVVGVCVRLLEYKVEWLLKIGEYSFSIYLLHELGTGIIVRLSTYGGVVLIALRPIINIMFVFVGIAFMNLIFTRFRKFKNVFNMLIGMR